MSSSVLRSSVLRRLALAIAVLLAIPVLAYLTLAGMQIYSAKRAAAMLDRLEALRVGSPEADFQRAVQPCTVERHDNGKSNCVLTAGAYRCLRPVLPSGLYSFVVGLLDRIGLKYWDITVSGSLRDRYLEQVSLSLYLVGRYEALGTKWELADRVRPQWEGDHFADSNPATVMHWYHISSAPSRGGIPTLRDSSQRGAGTAGTEYQSPVLSIAPRM